MQRFSDAAFEHNDWANLTVVKFCAGLPETDLDATSDGNYGTVRDTLLHIARAQERYVARLSVGSIDEVMPESGGFPGFDVLEKSLSESGTRLRQLGATVDTQEVREFQTAEGLYRIQLGVILVQAINHATDHRTQIKTILSSLGHEPPELDSWTWATESGKLEKLK